MDLDLLHRVFQAASTIRNKYPAVKRQIRYLQALKDDLNPSLATQNNISDEVARFRTFLVSNRNYESGTFQEPIYKGTKVSIDMSQVTNLLSEDNKATFMSALTDAKVSLFPRGLPEEQSQPSVGSDELRQFMQKTNLDKNGFLSSIVNKLVTSGMTNNPGNLSVSDMVNDPAFIDLADDISNNLSKGEYSKRDIEDSINCISDMINESDQPSPAKDIVGSLQSIMKDINSGRQPDMSGLMSQFSALQQSGDLPEGLPDMSMITNDLMSKMSKRRR